jgi:hypothetical protein
MLAYFRVLALTFLCLVSSAISCSADEPCKASLNVAIFGYIPDSDAVATRLKKAFAKCNSGYDLCLTPLDPYHDSDQGGMESLQHFGNFDVVEIDLCRLEDMRDGKIGLDALPLQEWTWYPTVDAVAGSAKAIVSSPDFRRYAVPHWICQNYMIRWAGNAPLKSAPLADELSPTQGKSVLGDFWGATGLGEFYANALANKVGPVAAEKSLRKLAALSSGQSPTITDLDETARNAVITLASRLPRQFRTHPAYYHNHSELYAWTFATNKKAIFIGYSEQLFYTKLSDDAANTAASPTPICPADVSVAPLSFFGDGAKGTPSWADGFVVPKGKLAAKKPAIERFIKFATTPEAYACFEQPEPEFAAANLLPAYEAVYTDAGTKRDEPLLPVFHDTFDASFVIDHSDVWRGMKVAGGLLEQAIQPSN